MRERIDVLRLAVDGAALELERYGDHDRPARRAPLVFLHEGLGSLTQWRGLPAEVCARSGRSGVAYARAGHGRSQPPVSRHGVRYLHHEAEVVLPELLARLGLDRAVLIGHSDGASIALRYAATAGADAGASSGPAVVALVLLAPHVLVEDCTVAGIAAAGEAYRKGLLRVGLVRHHDDADALFGAWHDSWLDPGFRSWDIRDGLERIEVPVLLIQGQDDQYGTMAQLDEIEGRVRGPVRRLELAGCGHSPHLEQREATVEAIAGFLEGLPDAG